MSDVARASRFDRATERLFVLTLGAAALTIAAAIVIRMTAASLWDDALMFLFDGGVLSAGEIAGLRLLDGELAAVRFCTVEEAAGLLRPYVWTRVRAALDALRTGDARYLHDGQPAT